jgi:hypothetical protein
MAGENITNYQWQLSTDDGDNFTNMTEGAPYSGTQSATLMVSPNSSLDSTLYRMIGYNPASADTSGAGILIIDNTPPDITSTHNDLIVGLNDNCETFLEDYTDDIIVTDNCDASLDFVQSPIVGTQISGTTNNITITVTDDEGNETQLNFNVSVVDNSYPYFMSDHGNQILADEGSCSASLPDYTGDVNAGDNCDDALEITQSPVAGSTISGATNNITLTVTDDVGNSSQVSFNVAIADDTDPLITSTHSDQNLDADVLCEANLPDYTGDLTATDNCDATLDITQSPPVGATISGATNAVTLTVTDGSGNTADASFNVSVIDNTNPVVTCPEDITVTAESSGTYTVNGTALDATATDNCSIISSLINNSNSAASLTGETFAIGIHTIQWTATDNNGNTANCSVNLTVEVSATGINDLMDLGIKIYPNPTNDYIAIDFKDPSIIQKVCLVDVVGRQLYFQEGQIPNQLQIDMSKYNDGIYLLNIQTEKNTVTKKVIKK